ncbi:MAG: OadG family transporter subunit [Lachnospiraceae bacterium]|jgi:uncharacterized membrane protein|nr:OadG family transporter subunit [Lachnospiraceae bacterium]MEE3461393.1 OadG family transporter subunit [Lachnospiraceae bacterium]
MKKKKRLLLFNILFLCLMFALGGCEFVRSNPEHTQDKLFPKADQIVQSWFATDFSSAVASPEQYGLTEEQVKKYEDTSKLQKDVGKLKSVESRKLSKSANSATVTELVQTSSGKKVQIDVTFDEDGTMSDWNADYYKTAGQVMGRAGLNTIMGILIVFCILIIIMLVLIFFDKIFADVSNAEDKKEEGNKVKRITKETPAKDAAHEDAETAASDDEEIAAVIAAAIAAAEADSGASNASGGLYVRSIVRR